ATGKAPFELAPKWLAARGKLNDATIFDFTSDNDIVGGNSGSPIVNAKAEVIGAVFDGNILSLGGAFAFDDAVNRGVSVSTAAATEALRTVYGQEALVGELTAP
ncbi:MAG: S46 family peptidase, partial [Caulobacteraceae bacterium]